MPPVPRKMRQDSGWPGMSFIAWNKRAAFALERRRGRRWDEDAVFREAVVLPALRGRVADIGGGKNPFLTAADGLTYVGLDIDPEELRRAPPVYTETRVCDIQRPPADLLGSFDVIICRYTLEHVENAQRAIEGLVAMLAPGGVCFGIVPCERAVFSRINRRLPEALKRRHQVWPDFHHAPDLEASGRVVDFLPDAAADAFSLRGGPAEVAEPALDFRVRSVTLSPRLERLPLLGGVFADAREVGAPRFVGRRVAVARSANSLNQHGRALSVRSLMPGTSLAHARGGEARLRPLRPDRP